VNVKRIAVLGSTGSIGESTLRVARHLKESIQVEALAAHSSVEILSAQIREFHPKLVALFDQEKAAILRREFPHLKIVAGIEGLCEVASSDLIDFVVIATSGLDALLPLVKAIEAKKGVGLANKESIVAGGEWIVQLARAHQVTIFPIDSEHSALFQCLEGRELSTVSRIVLTASGGPFRNYSSEQLKSISVKEALAHPTWKMGKQVTIDSSTLMNKGFEMIEARWLFNLPPEKIEVIIHPQSIVHSFVEFIDGSLLAQMSEPSMIYPIQYALTYPTRKKGMFPPFDFCKNSPLEFFPPDENRFPALRFAREALLSGGSLSPFLLGANQSLVSLFLKEKIEWLGMMQKLEKLLSQHKPYPLQSVQHILNAFLEGQKTAGI